MRLPTRGANRHRELQQFADQLIEINEKTGFKVSSRGWCYQLEGYGVITKGEFNRVNSLINECRKNGMLPIDFVAEESARKFKGVTRPSWHDETPEEALKSWIASTINAGEHYTPDYWDGEEYYIQMLVEKVDLVTLFEPVCNEFHIPIATSKGWSSILQRAEMAERFNEMESNGNIPVLLYAGDHDPFGLAISDYLLKNLWDIYEGTNWSPENLIIDRFGINYDFIMENNLTWIDNLETGSGKGPDLSNPIIDRYVSKYGERKVEANAIVTNPKAGRDLCRNAIYKYLGKEVTGRFNTKVDEVLSTFDDIQKRTGILEPLNNAYDLLDEDENND